ncbi:16S rRNA (adenine(1518)-N(6)/adenine(1519)-N(6))-dimethyltransferase RsmA [Lusitaniella coriacea LEGE 07157]|uniref:Ribosomal RNA small subunit methyltransferase A n=1 Tax=Lusitaniella coriacea LEGE 07157 TaxID=945747 RepID=A0A8J7DVX3_9CYAN|nr:16S rRNA (adenine(1518)-N(6)/adenine(1519)-N(6))-dimethyltransferase RsmA [Lusitaniella coriacea LEGE 07157]
MRKYFINPSRSLGNFLLYPQARKRFAQHWLRSDAILNRIVSAANLQSRNRVLEIGPGTGILTRRLLASAEGVVAVEIDRDLCQKLAKTLGKKDNFLLLQGDILSLDWEAHLQNFPRFQNPNKVVANIPYNITGPILELLLGTIAQPREPAFESIVLLVQKEIGERLTAKPNSKAFGALSVRMQYLAACDFICPVPAKAFVPPPKVDSAVVRLQPRLHDKGEPLSLVAENPRHLGQLVKLGFANRRKMLRNNLKGMVERDRAGQFLEQLEIDPQARAEQLSVEEWVKLSNYLLQTAENP